MSNLPAGLTQAEIDRYATLDRGIKALDAERKVLGAKIKSLVTGIGTFVFGDVVVKRSEAKSFDPALLADSMPYSAHPEYYAPEVNAQKVAALFPFSEYPDIYDLVVNPDQVPEDVKRDFSKVTPRLSVDVTK